MGRDRSFRKAHANVAADLPNIDRNPPVARRTQPQTKVIAFVNVILSLLKCYILRPLKNVQPADRLVPIFTARNEGCERLRE